MAKVPELSNGNRHSGNISIEGRILEGHTAAHRAASVAANHSLTISSSRFQKITTITAHHNMVMPAEAISAGLAFTITNIGVGGFNIVVKDDAGNTIVTISDGEQSTVVCDGTTWIHMGIITVALS